ncbi:hypothetical protein CHARACLAT_019349 [Characodon lateralis]|uniref:Secreted protein n=1 Tax=Characodon lateralis TaxID=208331 RepID=A0ABU7EWH9_9TELE|nr:hypothetical protein [Characodon lateralis]
MPFCRRTLAIAFLLGQWMRRRLWFHLLTQTTKRFLASCCRAETEKPPSIFRHETMDELLSFGPEPKQSWAVGLRLGGNQLHGNFLSLVLFKKTDTNRGIER